MGCRMCVRVCVSARGRVLLLGVGAEERGAGLTLVACGFMRENDTKVLRVILKHIHSSGRHSSVRV